MLVYEGLHLHTKVLAIRDVLLLETHDFDEVGPFVERPALQLVDCVFWGCSDCPAQPLEFLWAHTLLSLVFFVAVYDGFAHVRGLDVIHFLHKAV